eukprot:CAMPEP_0198533194 /NCGR_PEP_ID=MMETSP1462-20131121/32724_1 /TAXON_ID=1333877 /ORGANISM="Brandtodinium nutriculum, Strain RCC3387" /LENGTH=48 /DNA_ID= /DNA_START= /DNA_END= /DNA_ORIENTATION=
MPSQIFCNSASTFWQNSWAHFAFSALPLLVSFCITLVMMRQAARRLPT